MVSNVANKTTRSARRMARADGSMGSCGSKLPHRVPVSWSARLNHLNCQSRIPPHPDKRRVPPSSLK